MKNKYLKIILKPIRERNIGELLNMIKFYRTCTDKEFKYAMTVDYYLNTPNVWNHNQVMN